MDFSKLYLFALKYAQEVGQPIPNPELNSPNVTIQPGKPEANCALEILKLWNPNYFQGVSSIVVQPSADYGHVQSGPGQDHTVIYLNADRIVTESGGVYNGKAAALAAAKVIAHEKGHISSFDQQQGFQGGETPAEQEEQSFQSWLNSGGMERIQTLPCFQNLSGTI